MSMPNRLVLVRHGQSEANIIQGNRKSNPAAEAPAGFHDRHDSRMRLSMKGVEQAVKTGQWLLKEFPDGFDRYYVSSLSRTLETAGRLALGGKWHIDDRLRERDWGEYGTLSEEEQEKRYEISHKIKGQTKWYWCPPGGESLASGASLRVKDVFGTLAREMDGKNVVAVVHGETMEVARVILEKLLIPEWESQEEDEAFKISNCQVLDFSRIDPNSGEIDTHLKWRRSVCAWDPKRSWNKGQWAELERRQYGDDDLLDMAEQHPRLLSN